MEGFRFDSDFGFGSTQFVEVGGVVFQLHEEFKSVYEAKDSGQHLYRMGRIDDYEIFYEMYQDAEGGVREIFALYVR